MILGLKHGLVELIEHQTGWEENAKEKMEYLKIIFGDILVDIQHIGSTAIKHIKAKPIIDIVVGINDYNYINDVIEILKNNAIIHIPNADRDEFRLFYINNLENNMQTHRIHVVKHDNEEWNNKIIFKYYMNCNLEKAKEYEMVKIKSMEENKENPAKYHKSKEAFVKEKINEAKIWRKDLTKKTHYEKEINLGEKQEK